MFVPGGKEAFLGFGQKKTKRDLPSEFLSVESLELHHPDTEASAFPPHNIGSNIANNHERANAALERWRAESMAEVALAKEVGPPGAINLADCLEMDEDFLIKYYLGASGSSPQFLAESRLMIDNGIRQLARFWPPPDKAPKPCVVFDVDETALTAVRMLSQQEPPFSTIPELEHLWVCSASGACVDVRMLGNRTAAS